MAQVDVEWPSEDEDFDATIDKAIKSRAEKTDEPKRTAVAIQEPEEGISAEPAEAETTPEPESVPEPETEAPEQQASEPETIPAQTPPPAAPVNSSSSTAGQPGKGRTILEVVLVLAVIGLVGWSYTLLSAKNESQDKVIALQAEVKKLNDNPQIAVQKQTDDLLRKIGALIDLPKGETPTVANVSDAEAAKKQSAFFNNAQNGDRVLMYVKAGQAILYRPSTNKIILVAPLTFTDSAAKASTPATATKKP